MATVIHHAHQRLQSRINRPSPSIRRWLPYAAAVLIFLSIGIYWYTSNESNSLPAQQLSSKYGEDVLPGGNRAMLTFSDGSRVGLSEDKTGIVIGTDALTYDDGTPIEAVKTEYATLTTPNGGQYQVTLPDGSKVWINSASSLKYPTTFTDGERKVKLTGEAYFEINHNEQQPFIVESNGQSVQVLGTAFNINAYDNENKVVTSLVNGSIRITHHHTRETKLLQPNQQSIISEQSFAVRTVDAKDFTAWKDGMIVLHETDLPTLIRQLERWYDVTFDIADYPPPANLSGELLRDAKLSDILEALELNTGLTFKIQGRRVMVSK